MSILLAVYGALFISVGLASCSQDDGNYDYLPDEQVSQIKFSIDSLLTPNIYQYSKIMPGDTFDIHLKVDYPYADRLEFRWFVLKTYYNVYRAEQVDNEMVYPPADTIFWKKRPHGDLLAPFRYLFALLPGQRPRDGHGELPEPLR